MGEAEAEIADQVGEELAWTKVDLVLYEICKHLSVEDLKKVRLMNKSFCVAASKLLARKTLVRLTGLLDLRPAAEKVPVLVSHCSLDVDFYFECQCDLDAPKEYIPMERYMEFAEQAEFDSGLMVKSVSVVSGCDVWLLAILPYFSRLEELQVVTFRPSEGLRILVEFPRMFPNLKKLELKYIQRDVQQDESGAVADPAWTTTAIEDEKEGKKVAKIQLEELTITVSAYWPFVGSSVFERFRKLKTLKLLWCGDFPFWIESVLGEDIRYNQDGQLFGEWLQGPSFQSGFPMLNDMSLRFDLTPGNLRGVGEFLNSMKLEKVSLELYGHDFEVSQFILGLKPTVVAALIKVHWATAEHDGVFSVETISPALSWLGDHGFFSRTEWTFTIQASGYHYGVFSIVNTKTQLTCQTSDSAYGREILEQIHSQLPQLFSQFNYSVRRYGLDFGGVRYESEQFGHLDPAHHVSLSYGRKCKAVRDGLPRSVFECYDEWHRRMRSGMRGKDCQCPGLCRKPTVLLCEVPGFLRDARLVFPHEHPSYYRHVKTDVFCYVESNVLEKYTYLRSQYSQERLLGHHVTKIHINP